MGSQLSSLDDNVNIQLTAFSHMCLCMHACYRHESLPTLPSGWNGSQTIIYIPDYVLDLWGHCKKKNGFNLSKYHKVQRWLFPVPHSMMNTCVASVYMCVYVDILYIVENVHKLYVEHVQEQFSVHSLCVLCVHLWKMLMSVMQLTLNTTHSTKQKPSDSICVSSVKTEVSDNRM